MVPPQRSSGSTARRGAATRRREPTPTTTPTGSSSRRWPPAPRSASIRPGCSIGSTSWSASPIAPASPPTPGGSTSSPARRSSAPRSRSTPAERLDATLHREAIARLVPAWRDVPFFAKPKASRGSWRSRLSLRALRGPGAPVGKRTLIWDGDDGELVGELVANGGAWTELYDPDRVRELWAAVRSGDENAHYQDVFEGIVYREAFTSHLDLLAERAVREPSQDDLSTVRLDG